MSTTPTDPNVLQALIGVCGPSGSGKSSSLENLPAGTVIYDFERKGFPFDARTKGFDVRPFGETFDEKDASKMTTTAYARFRKDYKEVLSKKPPVVVIEGFLKLTQFVHGYSESIHKGYDAFKYYNKWTRDVLEFLKNPVCPIVITGINELVDVEKITEGGVKTTAQLNCFVVCTGQENRGKIEQDMLIVLHTKVKVHAEKNNEHFFTTQTDGVNTAKAPAWMKLPKLIPNDLGPVIRCLRENKPWTEIFPSKEVAK